MERLTRRINGVVVYVGAKNTYSTGQIPCEVEPAGVREMMNRLAAYEDTGLTPERCAEFARADAEGRYIVMRDAEQEGVARIRELAEADKDGRLVVLPSNKALTNADRMRTATNQQLAKQLYDTQKELCRILYEKLGFEDELNFSEDYSDILAWLNAPSKEAEKALEAKSND